VGPATSRSARAEGDSTSSIQLHVMFSTTEAQILAELHVPGMGTETMAPLLYQFARFTRARTIIEAGSGYTTAFLAKALADNRADFEAELEALKAKTESYVEDIELLPEDPPAPEPRSIQHATPVGLRALYVEKSSALARRRFTWLAQEPSWARPGYYCEDYRPQLFTIDNLSGRDGAASLVNSAIARLGLDRFVTSQALDFWEFPPASLPEERLPVDMLWIDLPVGPATVLRLLNGPLWDCLRPDGGVLIIHDMLTTRGGQFLVDELRRRQRSRQGCAFELLGLLQPQRLMQGDFVLLRKTTGKDVRPVDDVIQPPYRHVLEQEAERFLRQRRAEE
jgi:hypothetical protein